MKTFTETIRTKTPMKDLLHVKERRHNFFFKSLIAFLIMSLLIYASFEFSVYKQSSTPSVK